MKTLLIATLICCAAAFAGWRLAVAWKTPPAMNAPTTIALGGKLPPAAVPSVRPEAAAPQAPNSDTDSAKPDEASQTLVSAIDALVSPQSSFAQKRAIWDQLRKSGHLDQVIVALKGLAVENPSDAAISTALGEAEINQLRNIAESGGDSNEIAILALQADQDFSAALTLDPANWEAQFEKAAALSHWPASMNKGPEVLQRLSNLVTQQQSMTPQPEFAQTYVLLGQQYQSSGQGAKAAQVWQQGLAQFPLNTTLQQQLAHASNP